MSAHPPQRFALRKATRSAFTLIELVIASGIIALFMCGAFTALTQMNRFANTARLRTIALAVAQQRVDEVLTTAWSTASGRPAVLAIGTATEANLPLNNDPFNTQTGLASAYTALDVQVTATRTTAITDIIAGRALSALW